MFDWETGEQFPCGNCKRIECNGCVKPKIHPPTVREKTPARVEMMNDAMRIFLKVPKTPLVSHKDRGAKGGKKTAERGKTYFSDIARKRWSR